MRGDCMAVPLSDGSFATVDEADFHIVRHYHWFRHPAGYAQAYCRETYRANGGKRRAGGSAGHVLMHRVLTAAPKGLVVDHLNGNRLDNRRENLRVCTQSENMRNSMGSSRRKSRYRGVTNHKTGFIVMLHRRYVGWRKSEESAARLWDSAARAAGMGERHMNFPKGDSHVRAGQES